MADAKANNTVVLTVERYQTILDASMEQAIEIARLKKALKEEYDYAEDLIAEVNRLTQALNSFMHKDDAAPQEE